jgi:hypothetical protein
MKKLVPLALFALAATVCLTAQQQSSDSVVDAARKAQNKDGAAPAHKVWTNDDFPDQPAASASATDAAASGDTSAATGDAAKPADASSDKEKKAATGDQDKLDAEWKGKIDSEKSKIADLQREYDLTDREYKLASTTYYADAGSRLRDQKDFHDKEVEYRDKLANLKQQIADEQTKLADIQDQAHKAGANKAYD